MNEFQKAQRARILSCYGETPESLLQKSQENDLEKGGEGSKGGKIIGHTKSGKPIYESASGAHSSRQHANFTEQDHTDAAKLHFDKWNEHKKAGEADQARSNINQVGWHNQQGEKKRKDAEKATNPNKKGDKLTSKMERYKDDLESANEGDLDIDDVQKKHTKKTKDSHRKEIESGKSERIGHLFPDNNHIEIHRTSDGEHHFYDADAEEYRTLRKSEED